MKNRLESFRPYLRLLAYCKPYRRRLLPALVCMALSAVFAIIPPWLIKDVVDDVLIAGDALLLNVLSVGVLILYVMKAAFGYGHIYLMTWVAQKVIIDIRLELYEKTQRLSFGLLYRKRMGEFLSLITNDVATLQTILSTAVVDLIVQSVTFVGILCFLFLLNWKLILFAFAILPFAVFVIHKASSRLRRVGGQIQEQLARLSGIAQESLSSIRIVRAFATERLEFRRFEEQSRSHFKVLISGTQTRGLLEGFVEVILMAALALILWMGGREVLAGRITLGGLMAFLMYLGLLVQPVRTISRVVATLQQGIASADRIFGVLDERDEVSLPTSAVMPSPMRGEIVFEHVWFAYDAERWVLRDLQLRIAPGERVAIVGSTGAGKSTIADLLLRFYDPSRGRILVDGVDLRTIDLFRYRRRIGVVPQDPVLMKGSIAYNIAYGFDGATPEGIRAAARMAGIDDFVSSLPDGYDSEIGERGVTLSGGQRQRIAIARAVVRNPAILLMDEATSSLDALVESQVQSAMNEAASGRTSLVIAHRLSTVRESDRILVLREGTVVEEGTHDALVEARGVYYDLYSLQSGNADA